MKTSITGPMGATEWLLLITLSVLWGGSFFFNAVALDDLPPLTVVFARVAIAAGALWLVVVLRGQRLAVAPGLWLAFVAMGALNNTRRDAGDPASGGHVPDRVRPCRHRWTIHGRRPGLH